MICFIAEELNFFQEGLFEKLRGLTLKTKSVGLTYDQMLLWILYG